MVDEPFRQHLKAARPFGCLPAALLALGMGFVVFVGSIMGDCNPGARCHDHDGSHILNGFLWTLISAALVGTLSWLLSGIFRMIVRPIIGGVATNVVLVAMVLVTVWLSFDPAMEFLLWVTAPSAP